MKSVAQFADPIRLRKSKGSLTSHLAILNGFPRTLATPVYHVEIGRLDGMFLSQ